MNTDNTTVQLAIKKHLPQQLWEKAASFRIDPTYIEKESDLIVLILNSRSIDTTEEKQSWFDLLILMNEEQTNKLRDILTREREKLEEIEQKYEEKKIEIKKKYLLKRQSMGYEKQMTNIKAKESTDKEQEHAEADALLDNI
jgi:hypothetical protein